MLSIYPWQQQEWQYLLNRKNSGQLPHAILIKGMEGLGKYHLARCFAELLLCQNGSTKPCGECSACQLLKSNNHPDLIIIQPEEEGKAIKIDMVRDAIAELNNTPQQGRYKIMIIEHAELLNIAASNSLLKTLEEPPSNVIIILISDKPYALPATIRSRCLIMAIKPPSYAESHEWLKQQLPDADFKLILSLAENAPLKALNFDLQKRQEFFQNFYELWHKKINPVQMAEQCLHWDLRSLLTMFMHITSDIIKIKFTAEENIINKDQIKELVQLATKISIKNLFSYYAQLLKLHQYMIKSINLNQQLTAESLTITLSRLFAC